MKSPSEESTKIQQSQDQNPHEPTLRSLQNLEIFQHQEPFSMFAVVQSVSQSLKKNWIQLQVLDEHGKQGYVAVSTSLAHPVPDLSPGAVVHFTGLTRSEKRRQVPYFPVMVCSTSSRIQVCDSAQQSEDESLILRLRALSADLNSAHRVLSELTGDQLDEPMVTKNVVHLIEKSTREPNSNKVPDEAPKINIKIANNPIEAAHNSQSLPNTDTLTDGALDSQKQEKGSQNSSQPQQQQKIEPQEQHLTLEALDKFQLPDGRKVFTVSLVVALKALPKPNFATYDRQSSNCSVNHRLARTRNACKGCAQTITTTYYAGSYDAVAEFTDKTRPSAKISFTDGPVGTALFGVEGHELYRTHWYSFQEKNVDSIFLIEVEVSEKILNEGVLFAKKIIRATKIATQVEADRISSEVGAKFQLLSKPAVVEPKSIVPHDQKEEGSSEQTESNPSAGGFFGSTGTDSGQTSYHSSAGGLFGSGSTANGGLNFTPSAGGLFGSRNLFG